MEENRICWNGIGIDNTKGSELGKFDPSSIRFRSLFFLLGVKVNLTELDFHHNHNV